MTYGIWYQCPFCGVNQRCTSCFAFNGELCADVDCAIKAAHFSGMKVEGDITESKCRPLSLTQSVDRMGANREDKNER